MGCRWCGWRLPIEPEWLLDRAMERVSLEWNRTAERVEQVSALVYDQLVIEETRAPARRRREAARVAGAEGARGGDRSVLWIGRRWSSCSARAALAGITIDAEGALRAQCESCASFAELRDREFVGALRPAEVGEGRARGRLSLPGGREVKVHYEAGKPPWIESRLQDFFGMQETPRINGQAGGGASAGAESSAGAGDVGFEGVLGAAVSAGAEGIVAAVSEAQVAGEAGVVIGRCRSTRRRRW